MKTAQTRKHRLTKLELTRLEKSARNKHSSLFGLFVSYEENKVLRKQPLEFLHYKHYIFVSYRKWTDYVLSLCLFYCQALSLVWANTLAYYRICKLRICNVFIVQVRGIFKYRTESLQRLGPTKLILDMILKQTNQPKQPPHIPTPGNIRW